MWGVPTVQRRCDHCGKLFSAIEKGGGRTWSEVIADAGDHGEEEEHNDQLDDVAEDDLEDEEEDEEDGGELVDGAVEYHVVRCPCCGSRDTKVYTTKRPIRYHKCLADGCGLTFKSTEK